ncbi:hypothetical protein Tco_0341654 [Tanacetum coccineum]
MANLPEDEPVHPEPALAAPEPTPPSLDHVFDFPAEEPEPEPDKVPANMNGWIEWDVSLGNLRNDEEDELDIFMEDNEKEEWDVDEDWLMAPVTPLRVTVLPSSTYEVGGPSTAAPELPFPVGRLFSVVVDSVAVHHEEIGGLGVRTENLEHALGKLTMKTGEVSDAQVKDSIAIGEIRPKVTTLEGQVKVLANQHDLMINKVVEVESHVLKIKDRVDAHPCDQVAGLRGDVDRILRLSQQMDKGLTVLEERLQGPPHGPQPENISQLFLAQVTEKDLTEKRLQDVPVIRDFLKVFPDDFPGLPPP